MAKGINGVTVVSSERLQLFKQLQDILNAATFLGINATAKAAKKLETAVTIDGISFDGSANITLPTKVVQLYSTTTDGTTTYYSDANKTTAITTFDVNKIYVDLTTNEHLHFDGTNLVAAAASDNTQRIPMSMKGAANGVAELDDDGLVPASQLPSYVDDVINVIVETSGNTKSFFKATDSDSKGDAITTGEKGKIYVDINATVDGSYRWSGTQFVAIGSSVSTADRAVNDADGNPITTTYVKVQANKDLMTDEQATQLQTLVNATYEEATVDGIRNLFDATTLATYDATQG